MSRSFDCGGESTKQREILDVFSVSNSFVIFLEMKIHLRLYSSLIALKEAYGCQNR